MFSTIGEYYKNKSHDKDQRRHESRTEPSKMSVFLEKTQRRPGSRKRPDWSVFILQMSNKNIVSMISNQPRDFPLFQQTNLKGLH